MSDFDANRAELIEAHRMRLAETSLQYGEAVLRSEQDVVLRKQCPSLIGRALIYLGIGPDEAYGPKVVDEKSLTEAKSDVRTAAAALARLTFGESNQQ